MLGDPENWDPNSILGLFKKHGLDVKRRYDKQITYVMAEKVIIDFRNKNLKSFNFEQMEKCQNKVKERMNIEEFSNIEEHKESFFDKSYTGKLSFGKWLCYELYSYITLSKVNEKKKQESNEDEEAKEEETNIIEYIKTNKICRISSVIDEFSPEKVNLAVYNLLCKLWSTSPLTL